MARVAIEDFQGEETARIYLATSLSEAESVEAVLNQHVIDYAVEVEPYRGSMLVWFTEHKGAAFYVRDSQADFCAELLRSAGLTAGLLDKEFQ
ncbi:MAG: hypothetical protein FJ143_03700 [Deltaproteobacteria bacterium]|nr:hypothetical protein [Deltaproteobacteria bacterium]